MGALSGKIMFQYYMLQRVTPPEGMSDADITCRPCYDKYKEQNKEESKEAKDQHNALTRELYKRTPEYKKHWDKNGIIQYKNDRIAILRRQFGAQVEFIIAFDDLTLQGYELKAIDEGKTADGQAITGGVNSYYYFQKLATL